MATGSVEQDEGVIAVIVAFMRDAERMAELTAVFLKSLPPQINDGKNSWPAAFLLELGAVLRIRQWETAGIKDALDATLPSFEEAFADLKLRLRSEPELFIRGEAPLLLRVQRAWWFRCAHPNDPVLQVDVILSGVDSNRLISSVAQLLWKLRDIQLNSFDQ